MFCRRAHPASTPPVAAPPPVAPPPSRAPSAGISSPATPCPRPRFRQSRKLCRQCRPTAPSSAPPPQIRIPPHRRCLFPRPPEIRIPPLPRQAPQSPCSPSPRPSTRPLPTSKHAPPTSSAPASNAGAYASRSPTLIRLAPALARADLLATIGLPHVSGKRNSEPLKLLAVMFVCFLVPGACVLCQNPKGCLLCCRIRMPCLSVPLFFRRFRGC
jgi:hypothetical protein